MKIPEIRKNSPKFCNQTDPIAQENTWEPLVNLADADKAIKVYEREQESKAVVVPGSNKNNKRKNGPGSSGQQQPAKQQKTNEVKEKPRGFGRGLSAEKIIGIRKETEKLFFLIKWKGSEDTDFVDSREAKMKIPQVVIDFYEEKLNWFNDPADSQDEE